MALDTQYRPKTYDDVLGQAGTITICREVVKEGKGFHQSYLFGGPWGSGKTTLGRILARALLCAAPKDGNPCDECDSCKSILETGSNECLIEVDAATNSGKDNISKIIEDIEFGTFSGKRRIYIFDECHELSRSAMDAMLLPLEDSVPGSSDKKLVCIFCTTEPGKMRPAVLSRCSPAFIIRPVSPETIGKRLGTICQAEGIEFEDAALPLIAEATECHIRDALKAVEGVSMLGPITRESVIEYLHMDANGIYLEILESVGKDLKTAVEAAQRLLQRVSPSTCYKEMASLTMLAYTVGSLKVGQIPSWIDREKLIEVGKAHGEFLIEASSRFAKSPARATVSMFLCDVAALHQLAIGAVHTVISTQVPIQVQASSGSASQTIPSSDENPKTPVQQTQSPSTPGRMQTEAYVTTTGVYVDERARRGRHHESSSPNRGGLPPLSGVEFAQNLNRRLQELTANGGSSGRGHLGRP